MKKYLLLVFFFLIFASSGYAGALSKSEQCKRISKTMLEINARVLAMRHCRNSNHKEVHDKAYSGCMTGTEDEVGELYEKLQ